MPDARPLTGLYGKVPAHGDFVRRGLPTSFVGPWDAWLQEGMSVARERLGDRWAVAWDNAPPWRFALPAGACGPDAVAGVMLPSEDMVGRRFPITLAALLPPGSALPGPTWFAALELAALAGRAGQADADALASAIPQPGEEMANFDPVAGPAAILSMEPSGPAMPGDDDDVLALLGGGSAPSNLAAEPVAGSAPPRAAPDERDVLAIVGGPAPMPPIEDPATASAAVGDDILALLGGGGTAATPAAPSPVADDDVLALLGGASASAVPPEVTVSLHLETPAPASETDGTLAFLLGEGQAVGADAATPAADALSLLAAAGTMPAEWSPMSPPPAEPPAVEASPLPAPPPVVPVAEAPAAPSGGGWWTRGAAQVPPTAWPLPALPAVADFASLLEGHA